MKPNIRIVALGNMIPLSIATAASAHEGHVDHPQASPLHELAHFFAGIENVAVPAIAFLAAAGGAAMLLRRYRAKRNSA